MTDALFRRTTYLTALILIAGCATGPQPLINDRQGLPPGRSAPSPEAVDTLEVGHRLMDAGEFELAIKAFSRAAVEDGGSVDVLTGIGSAHLSLRRLNQAERYLRAALDIDDAFIPALNNLAVVLDAQGEIGEARELFRLAFALDNGETEEIRDNLRLLDTKLANFGRVETDISDFRLVRRAKGQYLLIGT